MSSRRKQ